MTVDVARKVGAPRRVLTKVEFSPEVEEAFNWLLEEYRGSLGPVEDDIEAWVAGADEDDLASLDSIRVELEDRVGEYTADFETVFSDGGERGAKAGRELAERRHSLGISYDVVPDRTLDVIDDWVDEAAGSTLETITEDTTRWLRSAHEEGLSIDDIVDELGGYYDDHLDDAVARRAARTATVSTSNTGSHSAHEDADGVIGERWVANLDGRQRESHGGADGQVVTVDGTFDVGGHSARYPGDPSLPVGELANCRCSVVPVFEDELTEEQLETILDGGTVWF
jgi:hypothetical protein